MGNSERIQRAISLGIAADTTEARNQLNQMFRTLRSVKDPTADLQKQMRLLRLELEAGLTTQKQFNAAEAKATLAAEKQKKAVSDLTAEYQKLQAAKKASEAVGPGREDLKFQQESLKRRRHEGRIAREEARQRVLGQLEAEQAAGREAAKRRRESLDQIRRSARSQAGVGPGQADLEYGRARAREAEATKKAADAEAIYNRNKATGLASQRVLNELEKQRAAGLAARADREAKLEQIRRSARKQAGVGPGQADLEYGRARSREAEATRRAAEAEAILNRNRSAGLATQRVLNELERQRTAGLEARAAREARLEQMRRGARNQAQVGPGQADLEYGRNLRALQSVGPSRDDFMYGQDWRRNRDEALNPPMAGNAIRTREQVATQRAGHAYMAQFDTPLEARNRRGLEADTMFRRGAITANEYARALRSISRETSLLHQATGGLRTAITMFTHPLVIAAAAIEGLRRSIQLAADLEKAKAKFEVFTGSAEEASRVLGELRKLSQTSPISFSGAQKATTTLLQFGVAAKDVVRAIRNIGEITGGDAERMENLSLAYAQSAAAGRLMGQELLQMVNAGFNPLKVIAKETGKDLATLRQEMSDGKITFDMVDAAFRKQAKEFATLDKISKTSAGSLQLFNSRMEELGTTVGQSLPIQDALTVINQSLGDMSMLLRENTQLFNELNTLGKDMTGIGLPKLSTKGFSGVSIMAQALDLGKLLGYKLSENKKGAVETYDRMRERSGGMFDLGNTTGGKKLEAWRQELKKLAEESEKAAKAVRTFEQAQADIDKSFAEPMEKLKEKIQEYKYGEDQYSALTALVGGLWGTDKARAQDEMDKAKDAATALTNMRGVVDDKKAFDAALAAYNKMIAMQAQVKANKDAIAAATEKEKKAAEELRKANDALSRLSEDATKISKANDPNSGYVDGVARATAAYVEGLLSSTELDAEKNRLLDEAVKSKKAENNRIAPSLKVGSQEAYSALVRAADSAQQRRDQTQERMAAAVENQNEISRETNRILLEVKDANLGDGG